MKAFLLTSLIIIAFIGSSGCGDSSNSADTPGGGTEPPLPVPAVGETITSIKIESTASTIQNSIPVSFGQVFSAGHVAQDKSVSARLLDGTALPLQVDKKTTHSDLSLHHAVLSTIIPELNPGENLTIELVLSNESISGAAVPVSRVLDNTEYDATIEATIDGEVFTASAKDILGNTASPDEWLTGPLVTEWQVKRALRSENGSLHPKLEARFNIRAYNGSDDVRTSVSLENTWLFEANPANITYDLKVNVGGTEVMNETVKHFQFARWRRLFHTEEPEIHIIHDLAYLKATKSIPNYLDGLTVPESTQADMFTEWNTGLSDSGSLAKNGLMGPGLIHEDFKDPGGRRDIGPLPLWTVNYLLNGDQRNKTVTLGTSEQGGSFTIHFRDKITDLPFTLTDFPDISIHENLLGTSDNPFTGCNGACSRPYTTDNAHPPSISYVPYLLTGDYYHLEEIQFWANTMSLYTDSAFRDEEQGLLKFAQIRGQAWGLRDMIHAARITPDSHPLKSYFETLLDNNLQWYLDQYVNQTPPNSLGFLLNGPTILYNEDRGIAPWQDDFFTWAVGHAAELGYSKATTLLLWKSEFIINRLLPDTQCWLLASSFSLNVRANSGSALYTTIDESYLDQFSSMDGVACASQAWADARGKELGEMEFSGGTQGGPSQMQPAMAVVVDESGHPDATTAYSLFDSRTNDIDFNTYGVWAIFPRN